MTALRVGIVGCGLIGRKRAESLGDDVLAGCFDPAADLGASLAADHGGQACASIEDVLALQPDVVVVATPHDRLARLAVQALESGAHVLVEKPAGIGVAQIDEVAHAAATAGRLVKVGFNHRFHPALRRAIEEARSGRFGPVLHARARYGHGGRLGYEREWRMDPAIGGGGEMIDQGMHLLDLYHWLLGPLPLHSALLTTQFWDAPVEDNAVVTVAAEEAWGTFHVTWTEWKNLFSLEIVCRTGKFAIDGLARSYGPQRLAIHAMKPELGPPDTEIVEYPPEDVSWREEWLHFSAAIRAGDGRPLLGDLESARYAWSIVEEAYARTGYPRTAA